MTARRGATLGGAVVFALLGLSGCVADAPPPVPVPSPSETPLFASDEEALAAAVEAYAAYLEMSDLIMSEGGAEPERIEAFVTEDQLETELEGFEYFRDKMIHSVGGSRFSDAVLQSATQSSGSVEVVLYVCLDTTEVRILDALGESFFEAEPRATVQVDFRNASGDSSLLVGGTSIWSSSSVCS